MTSNHREPLARIASEFVDGWNERIEFFVRVVVHTRDCLAISREMAPGEVKHRTCRCPKRLEARAKTIKHPALLMQLMSAAAKEAPVTGLENTPGGRSKPESAPPGNLDAFELLAEIKATVAMLHIVFAAERQQPPRRQGKLAHDLRALVGMANTAQDVFAATDALRSLARRARVLLIHDAPMRILADVSCGECGGALIVATDASSDVRCVGTDEQASCGTVYRRYQWAELLDSQESA